MDRFGGIFGAHGDAFDGSEQRDYHEVEDPADHGPHAPPSPVGQDERRMQVRAYNHWASLLGSNSFPDIADLQPERLEDFGPYGILLDFGGKPGVDDPAIRFLGAKLAQECGGDLEFKRLSDVPGRSLLSRITDHYLQILANQAPIGFEAEFTNQHGAAVLYRGILLPWSSDGEKIDFIFGVINWKEAADAATADALLAAIDAGLEDADDRGEEDEMNRMLDLTGFSLASSDDREQPASATLPAPAFGTPAEPAPLDLVEEAGDEPDAWGAGFSGFGEEDPVYAVDYGPQGLEDGEIDEDDDGVVDPLADDSVGLGLTALVARGVRARQGVILPGHDATGESAAAIHAAGETAAFEAAVPQAYEPEQKPAPLVRAPVYAPEAAPPATAEPVFELADEMIALDLSDEETLFAEDDDGGLYDCLAEARELAQTARSSEDRGRKALYQAVARAFDFSIEAAANPGDFDELLAENGLVVQDRAPMTPIVKLVFGADYDKTRLTEYATVLGYAHRTGVARGQLGDLLARADGGLKGIVQAERRFRREADGSAKAAPEALRPALARKLRKLNAIALDGLAGDGPEFALVMLRRTPEGGVEIIGEVPAGVAQVEKAARQLLG